MAKKNDIAVSGRVIRGQQYGRVLGFPTANIDRRQYKRRKLTIRLGVWAGKAYIQNSKAKVQEFTAAIVIGPLDAKGLPKLEAHLIGFSGNIYGKQLTLRLHRYVRPFKKYTTAKILQQAISKDITIIKTLMKA